MFKKREPDSDLVIKYLSNQSQQQHFVQRPLFSKLEYLTDSINYRTY